ncbi:MAG TPA: precorrin-6y C5,15-methyltransferase (decarboxylating) subunit CbiE [Alphaproteobacteria bacterium]|nr:precorrin-6y C5,15-methyltransferase (decarboxylating) subunit CbiE [Alphaproteobacteria bacterium]
MSTSASEQACRWLSIVGIGEDGLAGLSASARAFVADAKILVGGARHLAMLPDDGRERLTWTTPLSRLVDDILRRRPAPVCVLATGDPMHFGIGVTLAKRVPVAEMAIVPSVSAFSLACARLGWPLAEVEALTLHGRPLALLNGFLAPGARLLALSQNCATPAAVAAHLCARGYGRSHLTVLEHMGGPRERITAGTAKDWRVDGIADLNTVAIACVADEDAPLLPRIPGLPDEAFRHDGQLTKRELRAMTLAALAPVPGQLLWDVGAGCGSVAIEWLRCHPTCRAAAVERDAARRALIADNAAALGVPRLEIVAGSAPEALASLPPPDAVFIGGGATTPDLFETCWTALRPGGRLVANVVTVEGEQRLAAWRTAVGGALTRIAIARAEPLGPLSGWRPLLPVTQFAAVKR